MGFGFLENDLASRARFFKENKEWSQLRDHRGCGVERHGHFGILWNVSEGGYFLVGYFNRSMHYF